MNDVRVIVEQLRSYYLKMIEAGSMDDSQLFETEWVLGDIIAMVKPTYKFETHNCYIGRELTPLERTCSGLVSYLPCLLDKLSDLLMKLDIIMFSF